MNKSSVIIGTLLDENTHISFVEVCEQQGISEEALLEILEQGLLPDVNFPTKQLQFNLSMIHRIQSAHRLQTDLGINPSGVVLALELMDQLEELRKELQILQRHIK